MLQGGGAAGRSGCLTIEPGDAQGEDDGEEPAREGRRKTTEELCASWLHGRHVQTLAPRPVGPTSVAGAAPDSIRGTAGTFCCHTPALSFPPAHVTPFTNPPKDGHAEDLDLAHVEREGQQEDDLRVCIDEVLSYPKCPTFYE